jgi:hypothetical protein
MALVWFVKEGGSVTSGESHELSLPKCIEKLKLKKGDWKRDLNNEPRGNDHPLKDYRSFRSVFVEVGVAEAIEYGWKSGFYFLDISVKDATQRL